MLFRPILKAIVRIILLLLASGYLSRNLSYSFNTLLKFISRALPLWVVGFIRLLFFALISRRVFYFLLTLQI